MRKNPAKQRTLHIATEIVAVSAIAPVSWMISQNPHLPAWQRYFLKAAAIGTIAVDGYLLSKWFSERR